MKYNEILSTVKSNIDTFYSSLINDEFMNGLGGTVVKIALKNHYLFREISNDDKLYKKIVADLSKIYGEVVVKKIMKNIS